jgi:hypothetical protein
MSRAWLIAVVLVGCGSGLDGGLPDGGADDAVPDASVATKCAASDGWKPLISRSWALASSDEGYKCRRIQVPQDEWITGYCVRAPLGTHHTILTISDTAQATGDYDCTAESLDPKMLYAGGLATDDVMFPSGVAMRLGANQYINLTLHLFNLTDNALDGESAVFIKTVQPSAVVHEADMTFAGTYTINIPPDNTPHTAAGGCFAPVDWHVFGVWPHMHQLGTHQSLAITHGSSTTMMLNDDYAFSEQKTYPMPEMVIQQGDEIRTTCTYVNNTGAPVSFGDSTNAEVCFTGMYKWPAGGGMFGCTE